jgi:hypothetical protein
MFVLVAWPWYMDMEEKKSYFQQQISSQPSNYSKQAFN